MACRTGSEGGPYPNRSAGGTWPPGGSPGPGPATPSRSSRASLAGHDNADQAPVGAQPGQQAERIIAGSSTDDLVISPVPLTKLSLDDTSPVRIVVNDKQDRRIWHARHLWA